jgi:hypothetical protein
VLVNRDDPSSSLLLNKPTNRIRHVGGLKIEPNSADEQAMRTWVQHLATVPDSAVSAARARLADVKPAAAQQVGLRRLTHSQYNNTVRDLVGDYSRPADRFPPRTSSAASRTRRGRRASRRYSKTHTVRQPSALR